MLDRTPPPPPPSIKGFMKHDSFPSRLIDPGCFRFQLTALSSHWFFPSLSLQLVSQLRPRVCYTNSLRPFSFHFQPVHSWPVLLKGIIMFSFIVLHFMFIGHFDYEKAFCRSSLFFFTHFVVPSSPQGSSQSSLPQTREGTAL